MDRFLTDLLNGQSPRGVIDMCLDYSLTRPHHPDKFEEIKGLARFQDLELLSISGHALESTMGLRDLSRLRVLCLSLNQINRIEDLTGLDGLVSLDLSHNELAILTGMPALLALKELDLGHNFLPSVAGLACLGNLETLTLSGNRGIKSLAGLQGLQTLKALFLRQCYLTDWKSVAELQGLEELSISPGDTEGLEAAAFLPRLRRLYVQAARLPSALVLPPMPRLEELSVVMGPHVNEIAGLEAFANLKVLSLRGNGLDEVPLWEGMDRLEALDLSHNPLQNLKGLECLKSLKHVDLRNTSVAGTEVAELRTSGVEVVTG